MVDLVQFAAVDLDEIIAAGWLHAQDSWVVGSLLVTGMLVASRVGCAVGWHWHSKANDEGRGHFGGVQAAILGLLALLLGFTLSMADQRFEARRQLMLDDAVALGGLNLRAGFLREPDVTQFRALLGDYVTQYANADHLKHDRDSQGFRDQVARAEDLHRQMTAIVRSELQGTSPPAGIDAMVGQLGDVLAIHRRWITAMEAQVPPVIFALLFAAAFASAAVVGFSGGLAHHRAIVQSLLLTLFVGGILFVIHELDTPDTGLAQGGREPFLHLAEVLSGEATRQP
jgi:hypothetical protein